MYLGTAQQVTISGFDRDAVIIESNQYCKENNGYKLWNDIYIKSKWMGGLKWKKQYNIDLYKPNYKIIDCDANYKLNKNVFCIDGELYGTQDGLSLPSNGDEIIVANENNKLIVAKYPYSGLMGAKIIFSTKEFENSKLSSININADVFVLAVTAKNEK